MSEASPRPPTMVRAFEVVSIISLALAVIFGGAADIGGALFQIGMLALILLVSRGGYAWARWLMLILLLFGFLMIAATMVWQPDLYREAYSGGSFLEQAATALLYVLASAQVWLLLRPEMGAWIRSRASVRTAAN